ncbi:MAG: hypothetical protein EZS28_014429 [Streblomastix strix]|uniref:Uncharacterized protein n=1 Tax=Streblomastix strix TaxID=222440 RepID=A0A5J4W4Y5_9EUKA|nr:MAG: hypothetical protein EZS28_014429 [Streblomastix strix]
MLIKGRPFQRQQKKGCRADITNTSKRPSNINSYQALNCTRLVPQQSDCSRRLSAADACECIPSEFKDRSARLDKTITIPTSILSNVITAARVLQAGFSWQGTTQIDFYAQEPPQEQVVEARRRARAAADLAIREDLKTQQSITITDVVVQPGSHRFVRKIATVVQAIIGNHDLDCKSRLVNDIDIQSLQVQKHIRHDQQSVHDEGAHRYDRIGKSTENGTITSNTYSISQ